MKRFFSMACHSALGCIAAGAALAGPAMGQGVGGQGVGGQAATNASSGYFKDAQTGMVYRKVTRTVETPVTETRMQQQTQTVYKPQTVTESKPMSRTVYTPIIENRWEPRVHGRWNPFVQPTIQYHHVPTTHWTSRQETVQQTQTKTQWVPENRTVEIPTQTVRIDRQQKVDFEPVGQVAPPAASVQSAIAARLQPLGATDRIQPVHSPGAVASMPVTAFAAGTPVYTAPMYSPPRIAASTIGRMTSDPPRRNLSQGGLRANELVPSNGTHGSLLR